MWHSHVIVWPVRPALQRWNMLRLPAFHYVQTSLLKYYTTLCTETMIMTWESLAWTKVFVFEQCLSTNHSTDSMCSDLMSVCLPNINMQNRNVIRYQWEDTRIIMPNNINNNNNKKLCRPRGVAKEGLGGARRLGTNFLPSLKKYLPYDLFKENCWKKELSLFLSKFDICCLSLKHLQSLT